MKAWAFVSTAGLICLLVLYLRGVSRHAALDSLAVVKEVRQLNELVTVRYGIEKVVGMRRRNRRWVRSRFCYWCRGKYWQGLI